ncbi:Gag-Pol polyprotein [Labeo rohita]|uniref:Gag-Pol polyprotein n=1 Tax=Labeo rohita TaxID=84645 RepID=A0ABQ8LNH0_LABRO|nr:Gag-Pol polyprotein [Labeo rohita]
MDELRDQISLALLKLNNSDLFPVCRHLKCDEPVGGFENKTRRTLIRLVEKKLDDIEETEDKEVFLQCLEELLSLIDSLIQSTKAASNITPDEPNELDMLKEKYSRLQMEQAQARQTLEGEIVAMEQRLREETRAATVTLPVLPEMESGLRKGHSETEIIEAVTRAVSPGLHLRDMLEIKRDLTLPTLKTILRGHYKVDPPSDLLQKLMNITQDPKESAQNFLFRGIELREKLLWKLSEEDEGEQFSLELIQRKFLRSIETGLLSEAVKLQLKPYLSNPRIKDEELIERVNEASNLEQERQQKLKKNVMSKSPRLSEIQTNICPVESQLHSRGYMDPKSNDSSPAVKADSTSISKKSQVKQKEADPSMSQLIEQLRAEVLEMKRMVNETMETAKAKGRAERVIPVNANRLRGCRACQEARAGEQCNHCFRCGQEGHLSRGCRRPREQQGNGRGLLRRDPQ